ncbi:hypothetical protein AVEN_48268-1 [Araneus ventricosus]|uniref:Uncharacterized protein n=1 Tax=Araneus ventricosus TaxID=182803 RepID=A0A4Y2EP90_ARAVE|nr:hypothetical protein AVEN_48268-1 [Araneus ventricosus]
MELIVTQQDLGENLFKGIVGKSFADVTLKKKVQEYTLDAVGNTMVINKDPVVNLKQLFYHIACIVRSAEDLEGCLEY